MLDIDTAYMILAGVFSAGSAWGGAKVALNGTRQRVVEIKESFDKHVDLDNQNQTQVIDRLARIETKLDALIKD